MAISTDELYERALSLSKENFEDNFLDLGKMLRQLSDRDTDQYQKVLQKTDLGPRKAYYLIAISRTFDPLPIHRSRLRAIGWTKLKELPKHVKADNVEELLQLAEKHTAEQLRKLLAGEKPLNNSHVVMTYFSPKDYDELEAVLLANGASRSGRGLVNKEAAIMKIVRKIKQAGIGG